MKKLLSIVLIVVLSLALVVFFGCKKSDAPAKLADEAAEVIQNLENALDELTDEQKAAGEAQGAN